MHDTATSYMNDKTAEPAADSRHPVLADERFEIGTRPVETSSNDASERVTGRLSQKLWSLGATRDAHRSQLQYKPYFEFEATLRKKIIHGDDGVYDGAIIIDRLAGISRPVLKEQIETADERVNEIDGEPLETERIETGSRYRRRTHVVGSFRGSNYAN